MNTPTPSASRRVDAVRARVAELDLDGLLVRHLPNIRYLTGFTGSNAWLYVGARVALFATDGRYEIQADEEVAAGSGFRRLIARDDLLGTLLERLVADLAPGRVGFESARVSYSEWERLSEKASSVRWVGVADAVEQLRVVKDAAEIEAIREAGQIAAAAWEETLALARPGVREAELAAELDHRMRNLGAEGPAFETIVASGPRSALPHARSGDRRIGVGDLILFDFGARWRGYCSDLTRTVVLGRADPRQRDTYGRVWAAQREACEILRERRPGSEVDAAARDMFEAEGIGSAFPHSTGHGLGLEVHEAPSLRKGVQAELSADMVVTVEPGLYFAGWGGIRIEDDFRITAGEPERLTGPAGAELRILQA